MSYTLRGIAAAFYIAVSTVFWCAGLYVVSIARMLIPRGAVARRLGNWKDRMIDGWVASNRLLFRMLSITAIEKPKVLADLERQRWHVVVSNHQSWADIIVLQNLFVGRIPPLKFFTKKELIFVPFLGVAMWLLGFPYVRRYSRAKLEAEPHLRGIDKAATLAACKGFLERPTSVLSFLEGTRFTQTKHAAQASQFEHLLTPKSGGLGYVTEALSERIDDIVDVTIVYPSGVPTFWDFICGRCPQVAVSAKLHSRPPLDRSELHAWVESIWRDKDREIAATMASSAASQT